MIGDTMSLVDQLKSDLKTDHATAQFGRFLRLGVVAFAAQLTALGSDHLGWKALASAGVGAVEVAYREWAPTVSWAGITSRLRGLEGPRPVPSAPPASTNQQPPSAS
jgi:hypothetical protein